MSNYPLTYAELKAINQGLVTARREDQHRIKKLEAENLDLLRDLSISIEHNEQLQALIKKNKISFEKITEIKWAWDGDCGANNIAECALYDIDELEPQPPEDET